VTPTAPPPEPTTGPAARPPFSILIADDDRAGRDTLAGLLAERGFVTLQAGSGEEAVEIVQVELVHLVFFDLNMPGISGLEAYQQAKLVRDLLPAILMTADASREVLRQAFQAQVHSVLPKPLSKNLVLHTLDRALSKSYGVPPAPKPTTP
jgi:CheY-like chemotaxis protein